MADNTIINPGAGGDTIASDDIGGVKYQRVKVVYGIDGDANDVYYSAALPTHFGSTISATMNLLTQGQVDTLSVSNAQYCAPVIVSVANLAGGVVDITDSTGKRADYLLSLETGKATSRITTDGVYVFLHRGNVPLFTLTIPSDQPGWAGVFFTAVNSSVAALTQTQLKALASGQAYAPEDNTVQPLTQTLDGKLRVYADRGQIGSYYDRAGEMANVIAAANVTENWQQQERHSADRRGFEIR